MKSIFIALLLSCGAASCATLVSRTWEISTTVPDNSTLGWSDTRIIDTASGSILDVQVRLRISGGFNGDLYAYLAHDSGFAVLLNRPGRTAANPDGSFTTGVDAIFSSAAGLDAHEASSFAGIFQADGRNVSPYTVTDESPRTAMLSSFNGGDPSGAWTLFIADLSALQQSTVLEWGIDLLTDAEAVPEPSPLVGTALVLMLSLWKRRR